MPAALKSFLQRWLINAVAVMVAANLIKGIEYQTLGGLLVASLLLGIFNALLRPLLVLLSLPLVIFTLGLFTLVINALLLYRDRTRPPRTTGAILGVAVAISIVITIVAVLVVIGPLFLIVWLANQR